MKRLNLRISLLVCIVSLISAFDKDKPYCYQYRWIAPIFHNRPEKYNCTSLKGIPCIEPLFITEEPPNTIEFWENEGEDGTLCPLTTGNVCVKYTFIFNNNIQNTSSFCGKIVEDQMVAVTSGCYQQNLDGHILEACACQSRRGKEPCNASMKIQYSGILLMTSLLFIFKNFIY